MFDDTFTKDPDEVLDFTRNWTAWLAGDTILTSTFLVPAGLTKTQETNDGTSATVWLAGGADRGDYLVTNRITTAAGRTANRTWVITVRER